MTLNQLKNTLNLINDKMGDKEIFVKIELENGSTSIKKITDFDFYNDKIFLCSEK